MKRFLSWVSRAATVVLGYLTALATTVKATASRIKRLRMIEWMFVTAIMLSLVGVTSPVQLPVLLFKVCQVTLSGWIGYWFDRGIAPQTRPGNMDLTPNERAAASLRRAIIVAAAMVAGALGA
jgi:hypothetical protein